MKHRRTSLRSALESLARTFADSVVAAVREASVAEVIDLVTIPCEPLPSQSAPARVQRRRRAPTVTHSVTPKIETDDQTSPCTGTEINAVVLLESLEVRARGEVSPPAQRPQLVLLTEAPQPAAPAAVTPPSIPAASLQPRDGEEVLRTAGGAIVLRRRRAS